jgi:hypothetical protein
MVFPADGGLSKQIDWFRQQFLKIADKASSTKERGEFLKLAFMATLKGENALGSDGAMEQYAEHLGREKQRTEQARTQIDAPSWEIRRGLLGQQANPRSR